MLIKKKHKTTSRDNTNIFTIKDYFKAETDTILSKQREGVGGTIGFKCTDNWIGIWLVFDLFEGTSEQNQHLSQL